MCRMFLLVLRSSVGRVEWSQREGRGVEGIPRCGLGRRTFAAIDGGMFEEILDGRSRMCTPRSLYPQSLDI